MKWLDLGSQGMCAAVAQPAVSGVKRSAAEGFQVFEAVFLQGTGCRTKKLFSPRFVAANGSIADGIRKAWEILTVLKPCWQSSKCAAKGLPRHTSVCQAMYRVITGSTDDLLLQSRGSLATLLI
jgi:hypothetical protein